MDAEGRISQELLGNGLLTRRTYDRATGQLLEIKTGGALFAGAGANDASIQDVGYEYDQVNSVRTRWDHNVSLQGDYDYDSLDRLTYANFTHPSQPVMNLLLTYAYDAVGNMTQRTSRNDTLTYNYEMQTIAGLGARKRLTNASLIGDMMYDANGATLQSGNRFATFNNAHQAIRLTDGGSNVVQYTYGPGGNRLTKIDDRANGWHYDTVYVGGEYERSKVTGTQMGSFTEHRYPLSAGGRLIGTRIKLDWHSSGASTYRAEYYHEDALGSVEVVTDSIGRINKRWFYEPFGTRYDITALGLDHPDLVRQQKFLTFEQRGFTGHEHIDNLWFVHMNGRVYDNYTHRFLSADPNIQNPYDTQNFNRYSYVKNNPLKYTDPSGYFFKSLFKSIGKFIKKFWRPILAIAITVFTAGYGAGIAGAILGVGQTAATLAAGFVGGFAAGLVASGGDLRAGLIGGITGAAFAGIGMAYKAGSLGKVGSFGAKINKVVAHGTLGGVSSTANGGKFGHGFLSSSFSATFAVSTEGASWAGSPGGIVAASVVGGTASSLGGGKFANGAVLGAFSYAFNQALTGGPEYVNDQSDCKATGCVSVSLESGKRVWMTPSQATQMKTAQFAGANNLGDLTTTPSEAWSLMKGALQVAVFRNPTGLMAKLFNFGDTTNDVVQAVSAGDGSGVVGAIAGGVAGSGLKNVGMSANAAARVSIGVDAAASNAQSHYDQLP